MEYRQNNAGRLLWSPRIDAKDIGQDVVTKLLRLSSEMEVAKPYSVHRVIHDQIQDRNFKCFTLYIQPQDELEHAVPITLHANGEPLLSGAPFFPGWQRLYLLSGLQMATVVTLTTSKASSNLLLSM